MSRYASQLWDLANMRRFTGLRVAATELFAILVHIPIASAFHAQIAIACSRLCEDVVTRLSIDGVAGSGSSYVWDSADVRFMNRGDLDLLCSRYVQTCRVARMDWQYIGIPTDKGDSGALPLQQTFATFPDNMAFLFVPQVFCN
jgi:hypothetical protein